MQASCDPWVLSDSEVEGTIYSFSEGLRYLAALGLEGEWVDFQYSGAGELVPMGVLGGKAQLAPGHPHYLGASTLTISTAEVSAIMRRGASGASSRSRWQRGLSALSCERLWLEVASSKDAKQISAVLKPMRWKLCKVTFANANVLTMREAATKGQQKAGTPISGKRVELCSVFDESLSIVVLSRGKAAVYYMVSSADATGSGGCVCWVTKRT